MKKLLVCTLILFLSFVFFPVIGHAQKDSEVYINHFKASEAIIKDGHTLVPLRDISRGDEDVSVSWNQEKKQATIINSKQNKSISFIANIPSVKVNEMSVTINTKPIIIEGRIYVPLRFIAETFRYNINFFQYPSKKAVLIHSINEEDTKMYNSAELGESRLGATRLPRFLSDNLSTYGDSLGTFSVYFPKGKADRFIIQSGWTYSYYKVENYVANAVREVYINSNSDTETHAYLDFSNALVREEWGETPDYVKDINTEYLKVTLATHAGILSYFKINNGKEEKIGVFDLASSDEYEEKWLEINHGDRE